MTFRAPLQLGRNDLCHCGSGRKYKKCHLAEDERERIRAAREEDERPLSTEELLELCETLPQRVFEPERLERFKAETQPVIECLKRRSEIESACRALDSHREEFEKLLADETARGERIVSLFSEETFSGMWFTAAEVQEAFDTVGNPTVFAVEDERFGNTLKKAIEHAASKAKRQRLSLLLLRQLPDFVKAGRFLDASLIEWSALATAEHAAANEFLFQMFGKGLEAWAVEQNQRENAILASLGLDREEIGRMSLEEVETWLEAQRADPEKYAKLASLFVPEAIEDCLERTEEAAMEILKRPESRSVLITQEELEPWVPGIAEALSVLSEKFNSTPEGERTAEHTEQLGEMFWNSIGAMAEGIFNRPRLDQLIAQLASLARELERGGSKGDGAAILAMIAQLRHETEPGRNRFLLGLCCRSLDVVSGSLGNAEDA